MKNLLVTYVCFSTFTGSQDIVFQYLADSEEEAYQKFVEEGNCEEYEINEVFVDELTDKERELLN